MNWTLGVQPNLKGMCFDAHCDGLPYSKQFKVITKQFTCFSEINQEPERLEKHYENIT